jgi:hypothetical protein
MRPFALLLFVVCLSSSCAKQPNNTTHILGLSSGNGLTFTVAPQGQALSILYDTAIARWLSKDARSTAPNKIIERNGTLAVAGKDGRARVFIRGFVKAPLGSAKLNLMLGKNANDLSAQLGDENFVACMDAPLTAGMLPFHVKAVLQQREGEESTLSIDSIDVAILEDTESPLVNGRCPEAPIPAKRN